MLWLLDGHKAQFDQRSVSWPSIAARLLITPEGERALQGYVYNTGWVKEHKPPKQKREDLAQAAGALAQMISTLGLHSARPGWSTYFQGGQDGFYSISKLFLMVFVLCCTELHALVTAAEMMARKLAEHCDDVQSYHDTKVVTPHEWVHQQIHTKNAFDLSAIEREITDRLRRRPLYEAIGKCRPEHISIF
jgi:hypothetical protein